MLCELCQHHRLASLLPGSSQRVASSRPTYITLTQMSKYQISEQTITNPWPKNTVFLAQMLYTYYPDRVLYLGGELLTRVLDVTTEKAAHVFGGVVAGPRRC